MPPDIGNGDVDHSRDSATQLPPKRNRIQLSCSLCRQSKLKCDRGQPCNQCIRKDKRSLCVYAAVQTKNKPPRNMQHRLHHLESLVKDLMNAGDQSAKGPTTSVTSRSSNTTDGSPMGSTQQSRSPASESLPQEETNGIAGTVEHAGQFLLNSKETTYVGATHWAAILDDIEEVKGYFNDEQEDELEFQVPENGQTQGIGLGVMPTATKTSVFAAMPSKSVADRLVYRYFNSNDPALYIIHRPTFQKEYQNFWANPEDTPLGWLGLLYSLMALSTFFILRAGEQPLEARGTPMEMVATYRTLCSQCLVLANYTKPGPHILEAFALYLEGEFIQTKNAQTSCWMLNGLSLRIALRMGLHRDPKYLPNLTPYQGEMRRRIWHLLAQMEFLLSFHVGLPSMMNGLQTDTEPPRNLFDEEFGEDSLELPPSRPLTEYTPMLYVICKSGLMGVFGRVVEQVNSLIPPSYADVMALDARLQDAYTKIPPPIRVKPIGQSFADSPNLIIQRFNIILLFHKSRCILHRKYLFRDNATQSFKYSDDSCMDSAMELMHYQSQIHEAIQPGGPLNRDRWYVSALAMHDFLMAAMILYLRVNHSTPSSVLPDSQKQSMIGILQKSYAMFQEWGSETFGASKAARVLNFMLRNIERPGLTNKEILSEKGNQISKDSLSFGNTIPAWAEATQSIMDRNTYLPHSTDNTVDTTPSTMMDFTASSSGLPSQSLDDLAAMIDMPMNLDWQTWDNRINEGPPDPEFSWPGDDDLANFGMLTEDLSNLSTQYNFQR